MSIRTVLFLSLFLYSLPSFSLNFGGSLETPTINFLTKKEGQIGILDETYEPYFSQLQYKEIEIMTAEKIPQNKSIEEARDIAKRKFSSAVLNFTIREKKCLNHVIKAITTILNKRNLFLFSQLPWKLIKTQSWLCGGFAHTRGRYIILSQKHLDYLTADWALKMSDNDYKNITLKLGSLLVHEQFHCFQRMYPQKFDTLYTQKWAFKKVCVKSNEYVRVNQLSNPDAPKAEWAFKHDGQLYWVRTLINSDVEKPVMGKDLVDLVFCIQQDGECYKIITDSLNKTNSTRLDSLSAYSNLYPVTRGLDHPNEISAYMFSEYFQSIYLNSTPFKNCNENNVENTTKFVSWIDEELK